jgi:hypothetical protein
MREEIPDERDSNVLSRVEAAAFTPVKSFAPE